MMKSAAIVLFFLATVVAGDPNEAALSQLVVDEDASQPLFVSTSFRFASDTSCFQDH